MKDKDKMHDRDTSGKSDRQTEPGKQKSEETDSEFPGYPHYKSSEDIMSGASGAKKVNVDPDEINRNNAFTSTRSRNDEEKPVRALEDEEDSEDDDLIVPGTEADVTPEDLVLLGPKDQDMDMGDDELIRGKVQPIGLTDEELDVPEDDYVDEDEALGQDDEENSYYSLGGDRHEDLEEDNQQEREI